MSWLVSLVLVLGQATPPTTQSQPVTIPPVVELDMEGAKVEANGAKPELELIEVLPALKFSPKLPVRKSFEDEIEASVDEV